ncbi:MAG: nucleotidyltransferase substrate binding protein [Saprospiraceae bacterium]|jgi:nucleotidyltransferase substrate binding protein (TIGR01987 family)|nr:nucleotidyltransferase substrate binding protein [Saprospiraceae bacterium]
MEIDNRWHQRLSNYNKALNKLENAVEFINISFLDENEKKIMDLGLVLDEMIKEGLIQRFEYTHELAWNLMKDYAEYQGNNNVGGSRDATREALQLKIIEDGEIWMDMIQSRNKTTHTYNEATANEIYHKILEEYFPLFIKFKETMEEKRSREQQNLL